MFLNAGSRSIFDRRFSTPMYYPALTLTLTCGANHDRCLEWSTCELRRKPKRVCVYYCSTYYKAVRKGGGWKWRTCARLLSDGLESRPCPMHPLGIGVWDASRLIDPRNPPTSPGGWVYPLMDGHPHRYSTDFEQTLLDGDLARRGVGCP